MTTVPAGAPLSDLELNQVHPSMVVLKLVPEIQISGGQPRRRWFNRVRPTGKGGEEKPTARMPSAGLAQEPSKRDVNREISEPKLKREIRFPISPNKLVTHLFENIEDDTALVLGGLDGAFEDLIQNRLNPIAYRYKVDLSEKPFRKLINSLSATGIPGVQRTENALVEIFSTSLSGPELLEVVSNLRTDVDEFRKGKTYVYNQNKCVNSFLNLVTGPITPQIKAAMTRELKSLDAVEEWSEELINIWKKSKVIQSEKSLGTYQNVFRNFIKISLPNFKYGEFLAIELRKYLSISGYEKFIVKFQEFSELAWQERALCAQTDAFAFFPEKGGSTREAKRVCMSCEVRIECLDYALRHDEKFGVWGGLSERERKRLQERSVETGWATDEGPTNYLGSIRRIGAYLGLTDLLNEGTTKENSYLQQSSLDQGNKEFKTSFYSDEAIILRTQNLGEADTIITMLSRKHGCIRVIAKGDRRNKSKFGARLESGNRIDAQMYTGNNFEILKHAESLVNYGEILSGDYQRWTVASAIIEAVELITTQESNSREQEFKLLAEGMKALAGNLHDPYLILDSFLLRSLAASGFAPSLNDCSRCAQPGPHNHFSLIGRGSVCEDCRPSACATPDKGTLALMGALLNNDLELASKSDVKFKREASGLIAAYFQWHLMRGSRSLPMVERA